MQNLNDNISFIHTNIIESIHASGIAPVSRHLPLKRFMNRWKKHILCNNYFKPGMMVSYYGNGDYYYDRLRKITGRIENSLL